jgi:hypothetical protein
MKGINKIFISATIELIKEIGITNVSIRKIAAKTNMNSANIYYHFDNLDHLLGLDSIYFIQEYVLEVSEKVKIAKNSFEEYMIIWECFAHYAFLSPNLYRRIFFKLTKDYNLFEEFYSYFPKYKEKLNNDYLEIFMKDNIYERNKTLLKRVITDKKNIDILNEIHLLLFKGLLEEIELTKETSISKYKNKMKDFLILTLTPYIS